MPRHSSHLIPPDLRSRLEEARLDTQALVYALDQLGLRDPLPHINTLFELDADCAEALWALDQPTASLDFKAMVRDTLASLAKLPQARQAVRSRLPPPAAAAAAQLEKTIRVSLDPTEAYNDVPGRDPSAC
jgi:hypothetical protein